VFVRADRIRIGQIEDTFALHAIDFSWEGFEPVMTCAQVDTDDTCRFDLEDVSFAVSRKRVCVGQFGDEGHMPCPRNAPVGRLGQCPDCAGESFVPQECIFNPPEKCENESCKMPDFCRRPHILYLAFYDTKVKIGMSSTKRVERRLIEQGADAYALIGEFQSRDLAREMEKRISEEMRLAQYFRQESLMLNLARRVDTAGIEARLEGLKTSLSEAYQLSPGPLTWIDGYPIDLPLKTVPRLEPTWGMHRGEYIGCKGRLLIYEADGLVGLDLGDVPSRYLSRDGVF
jgi:hypothetical protein